MVQPQRIRFKHRTQTWDGEGSINVVAKIPYARQHLSFKNCLVFLQNFFPLCNKSTPPRGNCNYILFTKLPWPGDSKRTFRSSSQAATCPPVYYTQRRLHTVPLMAERQARKL